MISSRRRFLFGAGATLLAAPAIVRVASLMPVSALKGDVFAQMQAEYLEPQLQVFRVILKAKSAFTPTAPSNITLYSAGAAISWTAPPAVEVGDRFTIEGVYTRA